MKLFHLQKLSAAFFLLSLAFSSLLTGCGANQPLADDLQPGIALQGVLHGGQSAIVNAHIYLMAANQTSATPKGASTSLLTRGDGSDSVGFYVLTAADGSFNVSNDYTCTPNTQVYLLAMGGNPGPTIASPNPAATMVALMGNCPTSNTFAGVIPYIVVNEVSTVAAAYSVAAFATDFQHIGSANTTSGKLGLANAFRSAGNLVALGYGQAYTKTPAVAGYSATSGLSANGTVPQAKIYSLANALAACINSGFTAASTPPNTCSTLFSYTIYNSATPTNVFDATLNLAHSPTITSTNSGLFALASKTSPFYQGLTSAPNDWTISIKFSAPNTVYAARPAIDPSGDVWIPSAGGNALIELNTVGVVLSGTTGFTGGGIAAPDAIAIDTTSPTGAVWVSNLYTGNVSKFSLTGTPISATGYVTTDSVSYDAAMKGAQPIVSGNDAVSILTSTGTVSSVDSTTSVNSGLTVDPFGNIWVAQDDADTISKLTIAGAVSTPTTYHNGGLKGPVSLASDTLGDIWAANSGANTISEFSPTGAPISTSGYTGGGLLDPYSVRIDGGGQVFVGNSNGSLSEFSSGTVSGSPAAGTALSGSTGFTTASTASYAANPGTFVLGLAPTYGIVGLAIDQSGNVWAPDVDGSLYEFVGLAVPVTP